MSVQSKTEFGGVLVNAPDIGIGYETGAGGAVTQLTSKSTAVTLNTMCGQITMANSALNTSTAVGFTLTNSNIATTDTVVVNIDSATTTSTSYIAGVTAVGAGSCVITLFNLAGPILSDAVVLNFSVIKSVAA